MLPAKYAVLEPTKFIIPTNPGTGPAVAVCASTVAIGEVCWANNINKRAYDIYMAADKALKLHALQTLQEVFFKELKDDSVSYTRVTISDILKYLWANYGQINNDQLTANIMRVATPWSPPTPIDNLFNQLKTCIKFVVDGLDPITKATAISTGFLIIESNGLFPIAYRE